MGCHLLLFASTTGYSVGAPYYRLLLVEYTVVKRGRVTVPPPRCRLLGQHPPCSSSHLPAFLSLWTGVQSFPLVCGWGSLLPSRGDRILPGASSDCCQGLSVDVLTLSS